MRVITDPLGGSELTRAFLSRNTPSEWYPALGAPNAQEFLVANAAAAASEFAGRNWLDSLDAAFGGPSATPARVRLEKAARNGFVVTTGQQPGLFGGPVYTLSKAITALALANRLEKETGMPAAPVFWAATDDADFAECSNVIVPSSDGALELRIEKTDDVQRPLAHEPLPDVRAALDEFLQGAGSSSNAEIVELVRRSYEMKGTIGGSYVTLLRGILEPMGISVLDAAHVQVRTAGHALLQRALERAEEVARAITDRNAAIKQAGYKVQVREVKGRSLVFRYTSEGKERISVGHAVAALSSTKPGDLSATVLLRPVMERAILPTAAYVAGPAEVAYFAQVSAVAEALGAKQPIVLPRWSGTVLEPRVERILERYKLRPDEFSDPHALETRQARASIPDDIQSLLAKLRNAAESIAKVGADGKGGVPKAVLTGLQRDITHRLERFERRAAAMVKREGTKELHDLQVARASLYPMGKPQERVVSFVALLARYGSDLQSRILEAATMHIAGLK